MSIFTRFKSRFTESEIYREVIGISKAGRVDEVIEALPFVHPRYHSKIATRLTRDSHGKEVVEKLDHFTDPDQTKIAVALVKDNKPNFAIDSFPKLTEVKKPEVAKTLVRKKKEGLVFSRLDEFGPESINKIFSTLYWSRRRKAIANHTHHFNRGDLSWFNNRRLNAQLHGSLAKRFRREARYQLGEAKIASVSFVAKQADKVSAFYEKRKQKKIKAEQEAIAEQGHHHNFLAVLNEFYNGKVKETIEELQKDTLITKYKREMLTVLIREGHVHEVMKNLSVLPCHSHIFLELLNKHNKHSAHSSRLALDNIKSFYALDTACALKLLGKKSTAKFVHENMAHFVGLNSDVASKLLKQGNINIVIENLGSFAFLDKSIANKLIKAGHIDVVARSMGSFTDLDTEIEGKLCSSGYIADVARNVSSFREKDQVALVEWLLSKGLGSVLNDDRSRLGIVDLKAVDVGNIGSGTHVVGYYYSKKIEQPEKNGSNQAPEEHQPSWLARHSKRRNVPEKLVIDAQCITFTGKDPHDTVTRVIRNMTNSPEQWAHETREHVIEGWEASVNDGLQRILAGQHSSRQTPSSVQDPFAGAGLTW